MADHHLPSRAVALAALAWLGACGRGTAREAEPPPDVVEAVSPDGAVDAAPPDDVIDAAPEALDAAATDSDAHESDAPDEAAPARTDFDACALIATDRVPLPEASGAALLAGERLLIVADSGNQGRALILDLAQERSLPAALPLGDGAGDDVEGLERAPDGRIFGLTSAGYLRAWREEDGAFSLVLGPVAVSDDATWVCEPFGVNCAGNFEGLCLHPAPTGPCAGWAASKATGELVCLVPSALGEPGGTGYRLDASKRLKVTEPDRLSGCAYEPEPPYRLLAAGNLFSASALWEVGDDGSVRELSARGTGNQEAIALLPGGEIQSFGDAQDFLADESPRARFTCRVAP